MKIIGLITAWAAEKWMWSCLKQATDICDEVMVSVGYHSKKLSQIEDNTYEIAKNFKHPKIKLIDSECAGTHASSKAIILNKMLTKSKNFKPNNWLWILDVDEFYMPSTIQKIKTIINTKKFDSISIQAMFFYINCQHYLKSKHTRLFRIHNIGDKFKPTQNWIAGLGRHHTISTSSIEPGMFHYSLLVSPKYKELFWTTERHYSQNNKIKWLREIYNKYDLADEKKWTQLNQKLFNVKGPFYNNDFHGDFNGKLFKYFGDHPELIETMGATKIEDFRSVDSW